MLTRLSLNAASHPRSSSGWLVDPVLMGALTGRGPDYRGSPLSQGVGEVEGIGSPPVRFHPVTALKATLRQELMMCKGMVPGNTALLNFSLVLEGRRFVLVSGGGGLLFVGQATPRHTSPPFYKW